MSLILVPDAAGPASADRALDSADVVVIGAGPAGSAADAHLAAVSPRVTAAVATEALPHDDAAEREDAPAAYASRVEDALGHHGRMGRVSARLPDGPTVARLAATDALPHAPLMKRVLRHAAPTGTPVETCVTHPTMVTVTRAAAHPGTERGVEQR